MNSFVIGTVVGIESDQITVKATGEVLDVLKFGVLSGRICTPFDVFNSDKKIYPKVTALKEGMIVLAVVGSSVDAERGSLRTYLRNICECPADLRKQLIGLLSGQKGSA